MITRLPVAQARLTFGTTFMLSQQPLAACSTSYRPYTCLKMHHVKTTPSVSVVRPLTVRCMASSRNSEEKSWSELAKDAANLAASAVSKVGKSVSNAVRSLVPAPQEQQRRQPPSRPQRSYGNADGNYGKLNPWERERSGVGIGEGLVGGLLGRAAGAMLGGAMRQLQEQQQQTEALREYALARIQSDSRIRSRLGSSIAPGTGGSSTSTSSSYINGRSTTTTNLHFYVRGSTGQQAVASVQQAVSDANSDVVIKVQLPNGQVIQVDGAGGDSSMGGDVIDVEVRDVR